MHEISNQNYIYQRRAKNQHNFLKIILKIFFAPQISRQNNNKKRHRKNIQQINSSINIQIQHYNNQRNYKKYHQKQYFDQSKSSFIQFKFHFKKFVKKSNKRNNIENA